MNRPVALIQLNNILEMGNLRPRKVKGFIQAHQVIQCQVLICRSLFFLTHTLRFQPLRMTTYRASCQCATWGDLAYQRPKVLCMTLSKLFHKWHSVSLPEKWEFGLLSRDCLFYPRHFTSIYFFEYLLLL